MTVSPDKAAAFEEAVKGTVFARVGEVTADGLFTVTGRGGLERVKEELAGLKKVWQAPLDF